MHAREKNLQAMSILDANLAAFPKNVSTPRSGWVRAIRESLGMTREQLGKRIHSDRTGGPLSVSSVQALEEHESAGTVTLASLEQAAQALNCKLVYALVPVDSLESMACAQAARMNESLNHAVKRTMQLEDQDYLFPATSSASVPDARSLIGTSALWEG